VTDGWLGQRLIDDALADGRPAGWFEPLYAAVEQGATHVPWDDAEPNRLLVAWAEAARPAGASRRAAVVGAGLGEDAELVAGLGFDTLAFDVSETAMRLARRRFPDTVVDYRPADLFDLPAGWRGAFDLVVEAWTVQALPVETRAAAIAGVRSLLAPGGTLIAIATAYDGDDSGPPWPLTRAQVRSFADGDVRLVRLEEHPEGWLAELRRDG
jgi:SAM-dependent methyltransferase